MQIIIKGLPFDVDLPYSVGQPLGDLETNLLNTIWMRRLRDFTSHRISDQEVLDPSTRHLLAAMVKEIASTLTVSRRTSPEKDDVWEEGIDIASRLISAELARKEAPALSPDKLRSGAAALLLRRPDIIENARQRVASKRVVTMESLEAMDLI